MKEICRKNEAEGTEPSELANTVVNILRTTNPAGHYLVGPDSYLVAFVCKRLLPPWLCEAGVMWWYSVPATAAAAESKKAK